MARSVWKGPFVDAYVLKKAEKAEKMEKLVSDPTTQKLMGLTTDQKAKLEKWVPDCT